MFKKGDRVKLKYSVEKTMEMKLDSDVGKYLEDGVFYVIMEVHGMGDNPDHQILQIGVPTKGNLLFYSKVFMLDGKQSGFVMNIEEF